MKSRRKCFCGSVRCELFLPALTAETGTALLNVYQIFICTVQCSPNFLFDLQNAYLIFCLSSKILVWFSVCPAECLPDFPYNCPIELFYHCRNTPQSHSPSDCLKLNVAVDCWFNSQLYCTLLIRRRSLTVMGPGGKCTSLPSKGSGS